VDFAVGIDTVAIKEVSVALLKINIASLGQASIAAVNTVAASAYDLARQHMLANINLTDTYVQSQMRVDQATDPRQPQATITALRATARGTTLTTYGAQVAVKPVNWTNQRIAALGHKFGRWPGWTRRTGDAKRRIAEDQKAAGFDVAVTRAGSAHFGNAFVIPVRGRLLTVERARGSEKVKALYGPAPWQLFRATIPIIAGAVQDDLFKQVSVEIDKLVNQALGGTT
jgi:hypothetical protein